MSYFHFGEHSSEKERYKKIVECVTNLQDAHTLFVIDNFNRIDSAELDEIRKLLVDLLITTRCNLASIEKEYIDIMNSEEGESLFCENYKRKEELTYRDKRSIKEIVKLSRGYPLAIELIARAISYKNVKIADFLQELKAEDYRIENIDLSADSDWNGKDVNEQLAKQLSKVYQLSELNWREAEFIKIMSLLPALSVISYKDIAKYVAIECKDALITLDYRGWIKQTQEGIIMHEIVCESIVKKIQKVCTAFVNRSNGFKSCFTGMAPIPYTILAGTYLAAGKVRRYFEYRRADSKYYELSRSKKKNYQNLIASYPDQINAGATEVVVALSVTRKVQAADMSQFGTIDIVEIELPNPDDNVIKTIAQLDEYAGVVLNQIEGLKQIYPSICKVYLVASIPSCLSIELGKKFALNTHRLPQIISYHFVSSETPKYPFGVIVSDGVLGTGKLIKG